MKHLSFLCFLLGVCLVSSAQNLLNLTSWTIGSGSSGPFQMNGVASENIREWGTGPNGKRAILWKSTPNGDAEPDGGFNHDFFSVDHTKMYRFSIWIKKENSHDGISYFGTNNVTELSGIANSNPYFWYGDLPELNKWYLLIGYVHGSGDGSTTHLGGIYDGATGKKISEITDFKLVSTTTSINLRSYLYYDPNVNDRQYFYAPRVEVVNGEETSISTLLGLFTSQNQFDNNVGIKTPASPSYELAVNGKIRSKEVKVEANNWPDYVFAEDYKLKPLTEVEKFILANKHLPEIPSANVVEKSGLNLGEMNKILVKKIEELTLYLIQRDKEWEQSKKEIAELREMISKDRK